MANATPCGKPRMHPVSPASRSALNVDRLTIGHQRRNGSMRSAASEDIGGELMCALPCETMPDPQFAAAPWVHHAIAFVADSLYRWSRRRKRSQLDTRQHCGDQKGNDMEK